MKCPCHTECANGCSCPPQNELGNSYCPTLPIADPECLNSWEEISTECRDSCTYDAYQVSKILKKFLFLRYFSVFFLYLKILKIFSVCLQMSWEPRLYQ